MDMAHEITIQSIHVVSTQIILMIKTISLTHPMHTIREIMDIHPMNRTSNQIARLIKGISAIRPKVDMKSTLNHKPVIYIIDTKYLENFE